ncbi:MAG TPA: hypothetical protein VGB55_12880 [Tepidisphaeraceae bacterium]|jgi:hypothetical protein
MNKTTMALPAWLPQQVRDDPKKAGILTILLVVLLVMGGRYVTGNSTPATAIASSTATKAAVAVKGAKPAEPLAYSRVPKAWLKAEIDSVSRNLFAIETDNYPLSDPAAAAAAAPPSEGFWESIEKSRTELSDRKKRREILIENLQQDAAKLMLQSTVMGPEPQAIIGRQVVKVGDLVSSDESGRGNAFKILSIEARRVVVEREGIRLEIRMQQ